MFFLAGKFPQPDIILKIGQILELHVRQIYKYVTYIVSGVIDITTAIILPLLLLS